MLRNELPLLPATRQDRGSLALAAGPPLPVPAPARSEVILAGQPLPMPMRQKCHRARSPRGQCSWETTTSFTPLLTGLAGTVQWIYYPAQRSNF
jgi:hypothetical protein